MELKNIEILLEKYFDGETSISEEDELQKYFSSTDVSPKLSQYKPLFDYFSVAAVQQFGDKVPLKSKVNNTAWLPIAASVAVIVGIVSYLQYRNEVVNSDLGTYENPEVALIETQRALAMVSSHLNTGIESVLYIKEYKKSKNLIFKQ
jgi:hypothetical protein